MRCVSFGYAGKKLLIPLVTVFIVIVSCCVSPSAFLLTQGHSGVLNLFSMLHLSHWYLMVERSFKCPEQADFRSW